MSLQVTILKFHAVAKWTWGEHVNGDVCGICQTPFEGCPPGVKFPGDGAPVVWGKCGHAYHLQCISQWLTSKNSCPICRREWEFESSAGTEQQQQQQQDRLDDDEEEEEEAVSP